jgi:hypothetical protein
VSAASLFQLRTLPFLPFTQTKQPVALCRNHASTDPRVTTPHTYIL